MDRELTPQAVADSPGGYAMPSEVIEVEGDQDEGEREIKISVEEPEGKTQ